MSIIWIDAPTIRQTETQTETTTPESLAILQNFLTSEHETLIFGDVCQDVTLRTLKRNGSITIGELQTIHRCLDNAVAVLFLN